MPGPDLAVGQGQVVALLMAATGVALLILALALQGRSRSGRVGTHLRSAMVGVLFITAGLALLIVRRLDPTALSRVMANVTAVVFAAAVAEQRRRWPLTSGQLGCSHGHRCGAADVSCSPRNLPEELS